MNYQDYIFIKSYRIIKEFYRDKELKAFYAIYTFMLFEALLIVLPLIIFINYLLKLNDSIIFIVSLIVVIILFHYRDKRYNNKMVSKIEKFDFKRKRIYNFYTIFILVLSLVSYVFIFVFKNQLMWGENW